jgi:hypothetical protein
MTCSADAHCVHIIDIPIRQNMHAGLKTLEARDTIIGYPEQRMLVSGQDIERIVEINGSLDEQFCSFCYRTTP